MFINQRSGNFIKRISNIISTLLLLIFIASQNYYAQIESEKDFIRRIDSSLTKLVNIQKEIKTFIE